MGIRRTLTVAGAATALLVSMTGAAHADTPRAGQNTAQQQCAISAQPATQNGNQVTGVGLRSQACTGEAVVTLTLWKRVSLWPDTKLSEFTFDAVPHWRGSVTADCDGRGDYYVTISSSAEGDGADQQAPSRPLCA